MKFQRAFERMRKHGILREDNYVTTVAAAPESKDMKEVQANLQRMGSEYEQGRALAVAQQELKKQVGDLGLGGLWVNNRAPQRLATWAEMTSEYLRCETGASKEEAWSATMCLVSELHKAGAIVCHLSQADALNEAVTAYCENERRRKRHVTLAAAALHAN